MNALCRLALSGFRDALHGSPIERLRAMLSCEGWSSSLRARYLTCFTGAHTFRRMCPCPLTLRPMELSLPGSMRKRPHEAERLTIRAFLFGQVDECDQDVVFCPPRTARIFDCSRCRSFSHFLCFFVCPCHTRLAVRIIAQVGLCVNCTRLDFEGSAEILRFGELYYCGKGMVVSAWGAAQGSWPKHLTRGQLVVYWEYPERRVAATYQRIAGEAILPPYSVRRTSVCLKAPFCWRGEASWRDLPPPFFFSYLLSKPAVCEPNRSVLCRSTALRSSMSWSRLLASVILSGLSACCSSVWWWDVAADKTEARALM